MRKLHRIGCLILAFIMLVCSLVPALYVRAGSGSTTINLYGVYGQSEARTMESVINNFRHSSEAWWFADENMVNTVPADSPLSYLQIDTELEKVAMQRAAEISLMFSHTRPNGTPYTTAYPENLFQTMGENIAAGTSMNMMQAFEAWKEDGLPYSGQGHRRNMLSSLYTRIGIAYVKIDGMDYWVQEFGMRIDEENAPMGSSSPVNGRKKVRIEILNDLINKDPENPPSIEPAPNKDVEVEYGETKDPPYALVTYIPPGTLLPSSFNAERTFMLAPNDETPGDLGLPNGEFLKKEKKISNLDSDYESKNEEIVQVNPEGNLYGRKLGSAVVIISSKEYDNISDSFTVNVVPRDLKNAEIEFADHNNSFEFCGREITPEPIVTCDGKLLEKGIDYTLTYSNNRNAGSNAIVTVNGKGNYKGSKNAAFTITPLSIEGAVITLEYETTPYTGQEREPALVSMETEDYKFTVEVPNRAGGTNGGDLTVIPIKEGEDFYIVYKDNIEIGKATAVVHGKGNLILESLEGEFEIVRTKRGDALILLEYASTEYDGTEKEPEVTVDVDGTALREGTDFKVTYSDNTDVGEAGVKVEGLKLFSDIKDDLDFEITPRSIEDAEVTPEYSSAKYTGSELKPQVTVTLDDEELDEDEDYTVKYSDNTNAGTAKITVTGKGNYTDKAFGSFTITSPCTHSWDSGTVTKAATCKEKGVMTYTCTKCKETKTEEIKLADHTPGAAASCGTPQTCLVCGAQIAPATNNHSDSNNDGRCDVCGAGVPVTSTGNPLTTAGSPVVYQAAPTTAAPVSAPANAGSMTVYQYDTPNPNTGFGSVVLERTIQISFVLSLTACLTIIPAKHSNVKLKKKKQ